MSKIVEPALLALFALILAGQSDSSTSATLWYVNVFYWSMVALVRTVMWWGDRV